MNHQPLLSRVEVRRPAPGLTVRISKNSQLALSLCRLLWIGSVLLVLSTISPIPSATASTADDRSGDQVNKKAPPGMVWIPEGTFLMGTDEVDSFPNERPGHRVHVKGFWIDIYDVTNAEFAKFVDATGYVTTAERPVNWEDLKKELPPGTPKPDDGALAPGSMVFTPTAGPV
ncbi:MAG: SUMF1/EgtB/PvdO family nonheme iron enzyme, partial [Verrucomicrobia bacterium]|nr:SUMF1/EgtB/PvdO family nonheme iron enzyme [Verrucomicrobiota bacterium]